jgi:hypothetical protein
MSLTMQDVKEEINWHLERISHLFKPGAKLTILVRHPHIPDGDADVLLTDDTLTEAVEAIKRLDALNNEH